MRWASFPHRGAIAIAVVAEGQQVKVGQMGELPANADHPARRGHERIGNIRVMGQGDSRRRL